MASASATVTPLVGGYWNTVIRVQSEGCDWVVKVFAEDPPGTLFPILPEAEARALDVLAGTDVAPTPVEFLPQTEEGPAVLVYEWVEGAMWSSGVEQVAALFRRQHAVPADGFRLVPMSADGILEQGEGLLVDATLADAARLRARRPTPCAPHDAPRVLLHTDAGPGNLIVGGAGLRLIDWQCPALGDAAEDLFTFLSPAFQVLYGLEPLAADDRVAFLDAYNDDATAERLRELWSAFTYRMAAYCAMRRHALAASDAVAADRYARALDLSLEDLA